jgi:protein TilB
MGRITWDLIRKKAEHHDGLLEDLEELTLHQLNLEKIDTIGRFCPRLKILYLQNNLIPRLENLRRLSSLVYLNVALNNITEVPAEFARCEKIKKLDLTLNFIDLDAFESSLAALAQLEHLEELYLTGNPCTQFAHYRPLAVLRLPRLGKLDGLDVTRLERLQARASQAAIEAELAPLAEAKRAEKAAKAAADASAASAGAASAAAAADKPEGKDDDDLAEEKERAAGGASGSTAESYAEKSAKLSAHTPEARIAQHKEAEAFEAAKEAERKKAAKGNQPDDPWKQAQERMNQKVTAADLELLAKEGQLPKQRNMGKWDFFITESGGVRGEDVVLDLTLPKFLDTSLLDVDVHPLWVQVLIKGKMLLLHWPAEINVADSKVQRVRDTGHLIITCPKVRKIAATTISKPGAAAMGEQKEQAEDFDDESSDGSASSAAAAAAASASNAGITASVHANVVDLSSSNRGGSGAAASASSSSNNNGPSAFTVTRPLGHGGGLNQMGDFRSKSRSSEAAKRQADMDAQLRQVAVTRSATLEEKHLARQAEQEQQKQAAKQALHQEMERLGLDDSGVPDLE